MDDVNLSVSVVSQGWGWEREDDSTDGWCLRWSKEREERDRESGEKGSKRTFRLIKEQADRIIPGLTFTTDLPEDNPDGRCPMLDLKVWTESVDRQCVIRHTFFEKEISAPLVFHAKAAHSWRTKIVVLSEELRRRLRNTDRWHTLSERREIVGRFLQKLADSGYDPGMREEVIKSAVRKHHMAAGSQR